MLRKPLYLLVLCVVVIAIGQQPVATVASSSLTVCDYVERFKIVERPQEIVMSDIDWLENLPDFGEGTLDAIRTSIQTSGPIRSVTRLDALPSKLLTTKKKFLIRILFNLSGEETCHISS